MAGSGRGRAPGDYISVPPNAAAHVDAYFEYRAYELNNKLSWLSLICFYRIVGDDDGGQLFTPEEYDEYKRRVLPMVWIHFFQIQ